MTAYLLPWPRAKFFAPNTNYPLAGGKVYTYIAGTSTPLATYTDSSGSTPNANPIILDANGEAPIYLGLGLSYKINILDASNVQVPGYPVDNVIASDNGAQLRADLANTSNTALGAALVGYLPPGASAVGTSLYNKSTRYIDVFDFMTSAQIADVQARTLALDLSVPIANAIAAASTTGYKLRFPKGRYGYASQINLSQKLGVVLIGDGGKSAGAECATRLTFTGTGSGISINMQSATGCEIRDMQLDYSSASFTGTLISCNNDGIHGDPAFCGVYDCTIGASYQTAKLIDVDKCIEFWVERCNIFGGSASGAIRGAQVGSYSNAIHIRDNQFVNNVAGPIFYCGENWIIEGNTFEQLQGGTAGAVLCLSTTPVKGIAINNNWFGDVTTNGGTWITLSGGGLISTGNRFGGSSGSNCFSLNAFIGFEISGNHIDTFATFISFDTSGCDFGSVHSNKYISVTNIFSSTANWVGYGVLTYLFDGRMIQRGKVSVTTGTPLTITFATLGKAFSTTPESIQLTLSSPSGSGNVVYSSSESATQMTINVNGVAGSNFVYWEAIGV